MKKAEIKKIVLDLGKTEVELSPDQAKKLYDLLDEMYGQKFRDVPYPVYIEPFRYRPYWRYEEPFYYGGGATTGGEVTISYSADSESMCINL